MKKLLFIYNPHAGKGAVRSHLANLLDVFALAGWQITIHPTQGAGDAKSAAAHGSEYDRVICAGGDGTIHEIVNGLMELEQRPELGCIPTGTTNDFSKNLRLPAWIDAAGPIAAAGTPRAVDIGRFNESYFTYVAAFGAFTDIAYTTSQEIKNMFGHLAYLAGILPRFAAIRSHSMVIEHDGGTLEDNFCFGMITNTTSVGGFKISPAQPVELDDGLFEVTLVRQPKNPIQWQSIVKGLLQMAPDSQGMVTPFRTSRLKITCVDELSWTLDGEFGGNHAVVEVENCRKAITMIYGS